MIGKFVCGYCGKEGVSRRAPSGMLACEKCISEYLDCLKRFKEEGTGEEK